MEEVSVATTSQEQRSQDGPAEELAALGFCVDNLSALGPTLAATRLVRYRAGDTLYHQGSAVDALYVVRNGRIKLLNYLENGRARIVRLHNRGSTLGLNGLVDEDHTHTAVAIDEVQVYQIPISLIKVLKDEDAESYCQLMEYWHGYLNMADTWITDFSTGAIRGRVARLIRFLVEQDDATGPREVTLLTVEEMADVLGVTPESVSRVMADFKRNNILESLEDGLPDHYWCDLNAIDKEAGQ